MNKSRAKLVDASKACDNLPQNNSSLKIDPSVSLHSKECAEATNSWYVDPGSVYLNMPATLVHRTYRIRIFRCVRWRLYDMTVPLAPPDRHNGHVRLSQWEPAIERDAKTEINRMQRYTVLFWGAGLKPKFEASGSRESGVAKKMNLGVRLCLLRQ